jgi:hypothetical protein
MAIKAVDWGFIFFRHRHSRVWPGQFTQDWNRSFVLLPQGKPRGSVVLLRCRAVCPAAIVQKSGSSPA